jgi:hypothetical protein
VTCNRFVGAAVVALAQFYVITNPHAAGLIPVDGVAMTSCHRSATARAGAVRA